MADSQSDEFIRNRITELRIGRNISEHRMSLELNRSGSYIRGITSGMSMPSTRELLRIIHYFDMTPSEFFLPLEETPSAYRNLCERIRKLSDEDFSKVDLFVRWIEE